MGSDLLLVLDSFEKNAIIKCSPSDKYFLAQHSSYPIYSVPYSTGSILIRKFHSATANAEKSALGL